MGLSDRDYMKRPADDDPRRAASHDARLEAFLNGFLSRHPRFLVVAGVALAVLIVVSIIIARVADNGP